MSNAAYVAFLRAINVGGRVVKMERLRELFEELGLTNVETFIASGNVIFESRASVKSPRPQDRRASAQDARLRVGTFLRSEAEIAAIIGHRHFRPRS